MPFALDPTLPVWSADLHPCLSVAETIEGLKAEFKLDDWEYDPFGTVMDHWFNVSAALTLRGHEVPAHWEYRPGPLGPEIDLHHQHLMDVRPDALTAWGNILERYHRLMVAA